MRKKKGSSNFVGKMCVFVSRPMKILTFPWKNGDLPKLVVDFPWERDTFRNKIMEIVEDFDEKSYNNNGKPWKSSRILRVNQFVSFSFLFSSFFFIFLHFFRSFIFFHFLSFSFIFFHFLSCSFIFFHFHSFSFIFLHFLFFLFLGIDPARRNEPRQRKACQTCSMRRRNIKGRTNANTSAQGPRWRDTAGPSPSRPGSRGPLPGISSTGGAAPKWSLDSSSPAQARLGRGACGRW